MNKGGFAMNKFLKIFMPIFVTIISISIVVLFHTPICTADISYIKIDERIYEYSMYNLYEVELKNPKMITVTCNIKNTSYIKTAYNIELNFANANDISILPSNKIDSPEVDYLNLRPRERRKYRFNFIVDSKEYAEDELLELLKDIRFTLTGKVYVFDNIIKVFMHDKERSCLSPKEFNCQLR